MGVHLGELAVKRTIALEGLSGKIVAVDALNMIYQFLSSIRQEDGTPLMDYKGRVTAHLSGLFYRNARLIENGIRLVYVFDGKPPDFKEKTREAREGIKREAEEKWKKALEEERLEDARKYAQAASRLTDEMIEESKKLLNALGIPTVQAPSEGEAQAAIMVREGMAYASVSQDYDSLLFGSPVLVRNLSITGKRKVPRQERYVLIEPEEVRLDETLKALKINREQLILMGLLIGTDFNVGIRGVGPKTALKIVSEHKNLNSVRAHIKIKYDSEFPSDIEKIYDFFLKPASAKIGKLSFGKINAQEVRNILIEEHDFSPERVESTLNTIEKMSKERGAQKRLDEWV